ncbi:hypothetical protein SAMN04488112_11979 [Melghirimyces thermohalophilus]|uniref:Uncharacterized protein n=1 Tax=Melghirimyces thermohalophilus TaxID=1236220 RepID=A0A1G6Q628_9BACL|nr:hypothetical protein [Melghirimyces thermohalophilus]SDC87107.1 hypothetical protein SAMN04488112_11979 [Melghirimyces thermohalophilus]
MGPVRDALRLFRENVWQVFLVILLFVVPIQMVYTLAVNYTTLPFQVLGIPLWPALIKSFFMFIALFLIQLPFISMALQYARNEDIRLGKTLADAFHLRDEFFCFISHCDWFTTVDYSRFGFVPSVSRNFLCSYH